MKYYTLLLLDADNTLFDFDAAEKYALEKTFTDCGWDYSAEIFCFYHRCNDDLWKALERGEVTRDELKVSRFIQTRAFMEANGYTCATADYDAMSSAYLKNLGACSTLLDGAKELCAELSQFYRLCIITNGTASVQYSRIQNSGIADFFEHLFISEEIGHQKPAKEFFDKVFETYPNVKKEDMLVIGDSISSDIKGAIGAGLDCCYFNTGEAPEGIKVTYQAKSFEDIRKLLLPLSNI